ncbi:hypothetical protein EMIT043CA1_70238 [Pseudomonas brassicacearum]
MLAASYLAFAGFDRKSHVWRWYKCLELRAGVLMSFLVASTSQTEQVPDRSRLMINESVLHWRSDRFEGERDGGAEHHNYTLTPPGIRRAQHFRGSNDEDATTLGRRCRTGTGHQFHLGQRRNQNPEHRLR